MSKLYSSHQPQPIVFEKVGGYVSTRTLNYGIRETTEKEMEDLWNEFAPTANIDSPEPEEWFVSEHKWQYYQLKFPIGIWSYDVVVDAIIREKFSQSDMESITNNMTAVLSGFLQDLATNGILSATKWLVSNIDQDNTTRFSEMQAWRKFAKDTAKSYFK